MKRIITILLLAGLLLGTQKNYGQCSTLGQTPETAFPVCGEVTFSQTTVPICTSNSLFVPGCSNRAGSANYENKNPFWYKFTCFASGSLGFLIKPLDLGDDYDWQLYDVTGHAPNDIFTDNSLVVAGNWAGTFGATGARAGGVNFIQCASDPSTNAPSFSAMPNLVIGHNYILLVSHFTDSQSGYALSFGGGTAVITDPKLPALLSAEAACDAQQIKLVLNKKMKCKSLAADGSDFSINTAATSIIAAVATQCKNGFDMDTVTLTLSNPLPPGTFTITAKVSPIDNNTLLDNCDRQVPVGDNVSFTVYPLLPTPMDSITKVKCAPQTLELVFKKNIKCNTVAADGSDFIVTGPVPVVVTGASGFNCADGLSKKIIVQLSSPLQVAGTYNIRLKVGSDGNTIFDECSQQTPAGSNLSFAVADTVNADFTYSIIYGCDKDVVQYNYALRNGVNSWNWTFDNSITKTEQNPVIAYTDFRQKLAQLIVSNGVCSDTSKQTIFFDNLLVADFEVTSILCPNDPAKFVNNTIGRIVEWNWSFGSGNGGTSNVRTPNPQTYAPQVSSNYIAFPKLIVKNDYGCYDTITKPVKVVFSCFIAVPKAFTPNGDGVNDYLYPLNAYKSRELSFSVYNRFGQRVFFTNDWNMKWDGRFKGQGADPGTYVWVLNYISTETGKQVAQKGTSILIR